MRFRPQVECLERRDAPSVSGLTDGIAWQITGPVPYGLTLAQEVSTIQSSIDAWAHAANVHLPGPLTIQTVPGLTPVESNRGWWEQVAGETISLTTLRAYTTGHPPANPLVGPFNITQELEHALGQVLGIPEVPLSDPKDLAAVMGPFYSWQRSGALQPYDISQAVARYGPPLFPQLPSTTPVGMLTPTPSPTHLPGVSPRD